MEITFNEAQVISVSKFFSNMSVAWFIGGLISNTTILPQVNFLVCGILSLVISVVLLRAQK